MITLDAHVHVWTGEPDEFGLPGPPSVGRADTLDRLRPLTAAAGVESVVLVQTLGSEEETRRLLALGRSDPLVAGVIGWVDLAAADVAARLDRLRASAGGDRLAGIRTVLPRGNATADDDAVVHGMRAVAERGLALDLLLTAERLDDADELVGAAPEVRFVIDHLAKPTISPEGFERWRTAITRVSQRENAAVKLSGLLTQLDERQRASDLRSYLEVALEAFGPERMMIGSDWPLSEAASDYAQSIDLLAALAVPFSGMSVEESARIRVGTAAEWYRLEGLSAAPRASAARTPAGRR